MMAGGIDNGWPGIDAQIDDGTLIGNDSNYY